METFPGWIKAVATHDPNSEMKTKYWEHKRNDAWLAANAKVFEDAVEDAAKCWLDKGKKKDTAPPMAPTFKPKAQHSISFSNLHPLIVQHILR
ncbi:hypothetical protein CYLTODRAFT_460502 [Cylindrobasidium torrendii FP15055 ss-10]|uniref:Uncharacterized protein n=1 Tax=Cylindrobasidium torrendii FP15055 ss-10 TaxID=1314674 RepID=A0A0D7AR77_9AGAR|nr:hypothetical protein CYLTODRAFT_460502 [Cylindrobasidium torrendii FP15055 ss-10]